MGHESELRIVYQKNLPDFPSITNQLDSKEHFISTLSPYIEDLLNNHFANLLQIMYRIDVSEKDFALTLHPSNKIAPAKAITELIFDRLLLKAEIRAKYKNKNA